MANDSTTAAVDETERVIPQGQGHDVSSVATSRRVVRISTTTW